MMRENAVPLYRGRNAKDEHCFHDPDSHDKEANAYLDACGLALTQASTNFTQWDIVCTPQTWNKLHGEHGWGAAKGLVVLASAYERPQGSKTDTKAVSLPPCLFQLRLPEVRDWRVSTSALFPDPHRIAVVIPYRDTHDCPGLFFHSARRLLLPPGGDVSSGLDISPPQLFDACTAAITHLGIENQLIPLSLKSPDIKDLINNIEVKFGRCVVTAKWALVATDVDASSSVGSEGNDDLDQLGTFAGKLSTTFEDALLTGVSEGYLSSVTRDAIWADVGSPAIGDSDPSWYTSHSLRVALTSGGFVVVALARNKLAPIRCEPNTDIWAWVAGTDNSVEIFLPLLMLSANTAIVQESGQAARLVEWPGASTSTPSSSSQPPPGTFFELEWIDYTLNIGTFSLNPELGCNSMHWDSLLASFPNTDGAPHDDVVYQEHRLHCW